MSGKIYSPLIQDPLTKKYYRQKAKLHEGIVLTAQQQFISDLTKERDDYKTQRDTLIDDIAVLRANNERYRNRAENAMELAEKANCEVLKLERANAELMIASDKYTALTNHIRNMKFASPYSYNYIHLVNFIKELERADDEWTKHLYRRC